MQESFRFPKLCLLSQTFFYFFQTLFASTPPPPQPTSPSSLLVKNFAALGLKKIETLK